MADSPETTQNHKPFLATRSLSGLAAARKGRCLLTPVLNKGMEGSSSVSPLRDHSLFRLALSRIWLCMSSSRFARCDDHDGLQTPEIRSITLFLFIKATLTLSLTHIQLTFKWALQGRYFDSNNRLFFENGPEINQCRTNDQISSSVEQSINFLFNEEPLLTLVVLYRVFPPSRNDSIFSLPVSLLALSSGFDGLLLLTLSHPVREAR